MQAQLLRVVRILFYLDNTSGISRNLQLVERPGVSWQIHHDNFVYRHACRQYGAALYIVIDLNLDSDGSIQTCNRQIIGARHYGGNHQAVLSRADFQPLDIVCLQVRPGERNAVLIQKSGLDTAAGIQRKLLLSRRKLICLDFQVQRIPADPISNGDRRGTLSQHTDHYSGQIAMILFYADNLAVRGHGLDGSRRIAAKIQGSNNPVSCRHIA